MPTAGRGSGSTFIRSALRRRRCVGLDDAQVNAMLGRKQGAAERTGLSERADWTIDQGWEHYTVTEHRLWKTLFERQTKLLVGRACDEFVDGMNALPIGAEQIPDFRRLSDVLIKHTGWQVV